ncbi:YqgE/AlgH family protein [Celerinatantimonas yamalensis]|uniref:UPF0301 protein ABUE30_16075 n=1 Tax=Celerinatantimonas yamalensis TaxID=559956 RepID=A0ABW9GBM3_9GAMM
MENLKNQFLIAMPGFIDPFFKQSVVYVCEHNDEGAMGLVVNMPVELTIDNLLTQINMMDAEQDLKELAGHQVFQGGPVAQEHGFVLHTPQEGFSSSLALSSQLMITTSKDILTTLGTAKQPEHYLLTLGYAGWSTGQLEQEIADNAWLNIPATAEIIFNTPPHQRWEAATRQLGFEPWQLTADIGHA